MNHKNDYIDLFSVGLHFDFLCPNVIIEMLSCAGKQRHSSINLIKHAKFVDVVASLW